MFLQRHVFSTDQSCRAHNLVAVAPERQLKKGKKPDSAGPPS
jgi:hypothetical protein